MDHLNVTSSYMCSFLSITSNYFLHHIHPFWVHGIYRAMNGAHILASIERGLQTFFYRMSLHCIWTRKGSLNFVMINTCRCIYTSSRWNYLGCICIKGLGSYPCALICSLYGMNHFKHLLWWFHCIVKWQTQSSFLPLYLY